MSIIELMSISVKNSLDCIRITNDNEAYCVAETECGIYVSHIANGNMLNRVLSIRDFKNLLF